MSQPVPTQRPPVDLDDFERRMRQPYPEGLEEDPLAELARLVGEQHDPYQDVFAQEAVAPGYHAYGEPAPAHAQPHLAGNFAAIEAGLRGAISDHEHTEAHVEPHVYADPAYARAYGSETSEGRFSRSKRPIYLMAATITVGVLGVGAAFALKGHATGPSDVKTIMAASGPTKIQPPADATSDQGPQDAGVLGKGQPAPTKLVSNTEEPLDVAQAVRDNPVTAMTDASSVPVPPPPGQSAVDTAKGVTMPADFGVGMPAPKKVKVVSVRPDGTIVSDEPASAPAPAEAMAPAPEPAPPAPIAKTSTPKPSTPAPKSSTRITPRHVADTASDGAAPVDLPAPKPAKKAKPLKVASADPALPKPDDVAPDAKPTGTGGFAVQLAAPGSESEARSASSKLAKKFAGALDGRHLAFHKAQSNGKSVYRVRVSSLSKDEAVSLCEKLKADGGTCFVAKN